MLLLLHCEAELQVGPVCLYQVYPLSHQGAVFRTTLKSSKQQERQKKTRCTCCWLYGKSKVAQQSQNASKGIVAHSIAASACCSSFKGHLVKTQAWCMGGGGGGASFVQTLAFDGKQPLQSSHATTAFCRARGRGWLPLAWNCSISP